MLFAFVVSSLPAVSMAVLYTQRNSEGFVFPSYGLIFDILKPDGQRASSSPTLNGEYGFPRNSGPGGAAGGTEGGLASDGLSLCDDCKLG